MKNHIFSIEQNSRNIPTANEVASRVLLNHGTTDNGIEDGLQNWLEAEAQLLAEKHLTVNLIDWYHGYKNMSFSETNSSFMPSANDAVPDSKLLESQKTGGPEQSFEPDVPANSVSIDPNYLLNQLFNTIHPPVRGGINE